MNFLQESKGGGKVAPVGGRNGTGSGPGPLLHFDPLHFLLLLENCLVTLHGYYWQARVLWLVEA